jgi:hypothetical protein
MQDSPGPGPRPGLLARHSWPRDRDRLAERLPLAAALTAVLVGQDALDAYGLRHADQVALCDEVDGSADVRAPGRLVTFVCAMTFAVVARLSCDTLLARMFPGHEKGCLMEITNLGEADGLPPVDWAAIVAKLDAGSAPAPDAANSRTTWLSTVNQDGSPHVTAVGALWVMAPFGSRPVRARGRGAMSHAIHGVRSRCRSATRTS